MHADRVQPVSLYLAMHERRWHRHNQRWCLVLCEGWLPCPAVAVLVPCCCSASGPQLYVCSVYSHGVVSD